MRLTDLFAGAGHPVAYYPRLRELTGSINAALLLCQLIYWHGKQSDSQGWVYKRTKLTKEDPAGAHNPENQSIEYETGLKYREQLAARQELRLKGFLTERHVRSEHRLYWRVNFEALNRAWEQSGAGQVRKTEVAHADFVPGSYGFGTSLNGTYIYYTQTTAESTAESAASASKTEELEQSHPEEVGERIPSTPVEAMRHPDIQFFQEVCGRIPGVVHYQTVIEMMRHFRGQKGEGTVEYLRPFWLAWCGRRRRSDGKPYDPGSLTWLTEWALNGTIPAENGGSNERYRRRATAPRALTAADLAVAEIINARERERERGRPRESELSALSR